MRKLAWLLVIIVAIVIAYLLLSKVYPQIGTNIDKIVGVSMGTFIGGVITSVTRTEIWQTWGYYLSFAIGLAVMALFAYFWHQSYNKVTGWIVQRRLGESPIQPTITSTIATTPAGATTRPASTQTTAQPAQTVQTQPKIEEQKGETET